MKYLKMVIRLGLFTIYAPFWVLTLILCATFETIGILLDWLKDGDSKGLGYVATKEGLAVWKWIKGG